MIETLLNKIISGVNSHMRLFLCILVPWLGFFSVGRVGAGLLCMFLQFILIGWMPAAIWAVYTLIHVEVDEKIAAALARK